MAGLGHGPRILKAPGRRLPEVLSLDEVRLLLEAAPGPKHTAAGPPPLTRACASPRLRSR